MAATYLLVSHGSRDPRPQIAGERLAYLVRQQLQHCISPQRNRTAAGGSTAFLNRSERPFVRTVPLVGTASLECTAVPLHQQIQQFASQVVAAGGHRLQIVPLFLLPGVHVREDIPREVALARQALGGSVSLELQPHLGSNERLQPLIARKFAQLPAGGRILFCHGSRRLGVNEEIERLACQLGAVAAYWSVKPSLAEQVAAFASKGQQSIAISPYFLFSGGIVQAIARQVQELQAAFPSLQLHLGSPLGATPELAQFIVEGVEP